MDSGDMAYKPRFIKIGSSIQKFVRGTHREHSDLTSLLSYLFWNKESRLIKSTALLSWQELKYL
jgi:hypothetical protein